MSRSSDRNDESAYHGGGAVNLDANTILRLTGSASGVGFGVVAGVGDIDADQAAKKRHVASNDPSRENDHDTATVQTLLTTENPPLERGAHLYSSQTAMNPKTTEVAEKSMSAGDASALFRPPERPNIGFNENLANLPPAGSPSLIHGAEGVALGIDGIGQPIREESGSYTYPDHTTSSLLLSEGANQQSSLLVAELVLSEDDLRDQILNEVAVGALSVQAMRDPAIIRRRRYILGVLTVLALIGIVGGVAGVYGKPSPSVQTLSTPSPSGSISPSTEPSYAPSRSMLPSTEPTFVPSLSMSPTSILEALATIVALDQVVPAQGTPQLQSLVWLIEHQQQLSSHSDEELRARYALAILVFTGTTMAPLSEDSHCTWSGITCNEDLQVTAINATTLDLTAFQFPPELVLLSGSLTSLVYDGSNYEGTLPTEVGRLTNLTHLLLSSIGLKGALPSELGMLAKVQELSIRKSSMAGVLPTEVGLLTNLRRLDFSHNDFNSSIPTEIGQLTQLMLLDMSDNSFGGGVLSQLTRLSNLVVLNVANNKLTEDLQNHTFENLSSLETLDLSQNEFLCTYCRISIATPSSDYQRGGFPSLRSNTLLTYLDVSTNKFFRSSIPAALEYMTNLVHLNMSNGRFSSGIPENLKLLTKLTSIDLSANELSAGSWGSNFNISFNLSNLTSLEFFNLTDNCVKAYLPCEFFPLSATTNKTIYVDRDFINCTGACCAPAVFVHRYNNGVPQCPIQQLP